MRLFFFLRLWEVIST